MATDSGYEKGNYLRACDICGHRYHFRDLTPIGELRFACPEDAPGLTSVQISRFNARARPLVVRPNKWAKDYSQTGIYQLAEAQIFNFIAKAAPSDNYDIAATVAPAGWAGVYMGEVVAQAKRPANWVRTATSVLRTCAAYLISRQVGGGLLTSLPSTDRRFGGVTDGLATGGEFSTATYYTNDVIAAGITFIRTYQATGNGAYLDAADRCAHFLRNSQCADLSTTAYAIFPAGGARYHVGGFSTSLDDGSGHYSASYAVGDLLGAWFLTLLADIRGSAAQYGSTTAGAFVSSPAASLSRTLSELRTFTETGPRDSTFGGATTPGLSATSPRTTYGAATQGGAGTGAWSQSATATTDQLGMGLRGLFEAFGLTSQVSAMLDMLGALTANPANATPDGLTDEQVLQGITGTFDASVCPPESITTDFPSSSPPFMEAGGSVYSWATIGLLAPMISARNQSTLRKGKDALSTARRFTTTDISLKWLGPLGLSGFSYQPTIIGHSLTRAAKAGLAYRNDPGRYPALRGN